MTESPIEDALDAFYARLHLPARDARRALADCEAHLREAAAEELTRGRTLLEAERAAVERFGDPGAVAASYGYGLRTRLAGLNPLAVLRAACALAGLGLVGIGVSGGVAAIFNRVFGQRLVGGGPTPGWQHCAGISAAGVRQLVSCGPSVAEVAADAVSLRVLAGAVGVVLLAVSWLIGRYRGFDAGPLDRRVIAALAALGFLAGAVVLIGVSVDGALTYGRDGAGFYLSGAIVCVLAAPAFALRVWRGGAASSGPWGTSGTSGTLGGRTG